jgi:acyl carrier protein
MSTFDKVREILADILDLDEDQIKQNTYLIRELNAESIDLLEIAVALNSEFNKEVVDDGIFLKNLRLYISEAEEKKIDSAEYLLKKYSHLAKDRIDDIISEIENGPTLKVCDLISYLEG